MLLLLAGTKKNKRKPRIIFKRNLKIFNEQAVHHDLSLVNWGHIGLLPDVELAWTFFKEHFVKIVNKHAPSGNSGLRDEIIPGFPQSCQIPSIDVMWHGPKPEKVSWPLTGLFSGN